MAEYTRAGEGEGQGGLSGTPRNGRKHGRRHRLRSGDEIKSPAPTSMEGQITPCARREVRSRPIASPLASLEIAPPRHPDAALSDADAMQLRDNKQQTMDEFWIEARQVTP